MQAKQGSCIKAGDHKGRPYRVGRYTVAPPRAAGPTDKDAPEVPETSGACLFGQSRLAMGR